MSNPSARVSAGVPTGGQFARNSQAVSDPELDDYGCEPGCDHEAEMEQAHQALLHAESISAELSAKIGMPVQVSKPETDHYVPGRFNATVEAGDVATTVAFDLGEDTTADAVTELAPKFTSDPVFRRNKKAADKPARDAPAPVFTEPTADINAFDPAARAALIASLQPKQASHDGQYSSFVGAKYDGYQPAAVIAKKVRADLKAAQASRALPDGVTYTVHSDSYAGGQAIRITAMGLPNSAMTREDQWSIGPRRTTEIAELDRTLMAIGQAYDRSQSGMDMHNGTYYCQTTFEDEHSRMYRQFEKAEKPIQTAWQREGAGTPNWPNTARGVELATQRQELIAAQAAYRAAHPQRGYGH